MSAEESKLILAAREGDTVAFGALYRMHRNAVLGVCIRRLQDRELAEDATQDTFVRAYANLASFDASLPLLPWLRAIAARRCIDLARRMSKIAPGDPTGDRCIDTLDPDPTGRAVLAAEERRKLEWALRRIAPRQRRALLLHAVEGWSYADIAEAEGISIASTKALLFHARDNLKRACRRGLLAAFVFPAVALHRRARDLVVAVRVRSRFAAEPFVGAAGGTLGQTVAALAIALMALTPQGAQASFRAATQSGSPSTTAAQAFRAGLGASTSPIFASLGPRPTGGTMVGNLLHPTQNARPEDTQFTSIAPSPDYEDDHTLVAAGRVPCASTLCPVLFMSHDGGASWQQRAAEGFAGHDILLPPSFPADPRIFAMGADGLEVSDNLGVSFRTALPVQGQAAISPLFNAGDPRVLVANAAVIEYWASTATAKPATMVGPLGQWLTVTFSPTYARDKIIFVGGLRAASDGTVRSAVYRCDVAVCGTTDLPGAIGAPWVRASSRFADDHLLYAFTSNGMFRSPDGGRTFTAVSPAVDPSEGAVRDVYIGGSEKRPVVLAAVQSAKAGGDGLYRSLDDGRTWNLIRITEPGFEHGAVGLYGVAGDRLFAIGMTRGIACSTDGGLTWRARCAPAVS